MYTRNFVRFATCQLLFCIEVYCIYFSTVGSPIHVPKVENPPQELIDEYHQKYTDALVSIFKQYKGKYHVLGEDAELQIV